MGIGITLNYSRNVLRREGFALSKTAASFRGSILIADDTSTTGYRYVPSDLGEDELTEDSFRNDPGLWQIPETGVIRLRPSIFRADFVESADWAPYWIPLSGFRYTEGEVREVPQDHLPSQPKLITTQRTDLDTELAGLSTIPAGVSGLDVETRFSLVWGLETTASLYTNEGVGFTIQPFGIATDRAASFFGVLIGGRLFAELSMNGTASVYENVGTAASQKWVKRRRFEFSQGGVDHTRAFQFSIIPWGIDAISFVFSQAAVGNPAEASTYKAAVENSFLYEIRKHGGKCPFVPSLGQSEKYPAATLAIAYRKDRYAVAFGVARIRYKASGLRLTAENIGIPRPGSTPIVTPIGFFNQKLELGDIPANVYESKTSAVIGARYRNDENATWTPANDRKIVAGCWLKPSAKDFSGSANGDIGVYSPEIWAMEYEIAPTVHAPGDDIDLSANWCKIAFRLSTEPDASYLDLLHRRTEDYRNLFKLDAGVDLTIDDVPIFEGEVIHSRPTIEGGFKGPKPEANPEPEDFKTRPIITDDMSAGDLWAALNETSASHFLSLTKRSYGLLIEKALKMGGCDQSTLTLVSGYYENDDISIAAELFSIEVDGWEQANDWKQTSENSTVGDILRMLIDLYGMGGKHGPRDMRINRRGRKWRAYLAASYDPEVSPSVIFYLDERCLPPAIRSLTPAERWAGVEGVKYFAIFSPPEFTIRRPQFNSVTAFSSSGGGRGSDAYAAFLPPKPEVLTDPSYWDFQARVRNRTFGVNEMGMISTLNELQRATRRKGDTLCRTLIGLVYDAEWQTSIDTDIFAAVVGSAVYDVAEASISEGDPISYGAFRLHDIAIEIEKVEPTAETPEGALWGYEDSDARTGMRQGRYTVEYAGATALDDFPMFSDMIPDYGRPE